LFDVHYYLETNPDAAAAGVNPLDRYMAFGAAEGRDPSAAFSTNTYLTAFEDVAAAGINPLQHLLKFGLAEGRDLLLIWRRKEAPPRATAVTRKASMSDASRKQRPASATCGLFRTYW
jgi:hypothetical protein